jgi:hypothetical protein
MLCRAAALIVVLAACSNPPKTPDAPSSPWSLGPPLPVPRLEPGVASLGQQLVVLGGFDTDLSAGLDITMRVDVLDVGSNTWSQLPDAPVAWTHVQLASVGATLYLLGGLAGQSYTAQGEAYALDTLSPPLAWRQLTAMPAGLERGSAAVVVVPPRIYLFGGASTTTALSSVIFYDTTRDAWCPGAACATPSDQPADLPGPRSHPAAMRRIDGTFVVVGGLAGLFADSAAADVWQLAAGATAWQPTTPMPVARGGCAYGAIAGSLVCAGGEASTSALSYTETYNPIDDTWVDDPLMPESRAGTQGAAIGERLFVPGGSRTVPTITSGFEPTDTLYIYSPLDTAQP